MLTLNEKDIEYLDLRYKRIEDCDRDMAATTKFSAELDKRLAVIEHAQRVNNWLTAAIAGGIIALVMKVFIGG